MISGILDIGGKRFVVLPEPDYAKLVGRQREELPSLPGPNRDGTVDALPYSRASIARDIIRDRTALGLTQAELARRAGIRPETLNRIEKLKTASATRILERIDRALRAAEHSGVRGRSAQAGSSKSSATAPH